ncbi:MULTISPECIES: Bug family tripartite tricarboxylate transporter substrate binding protein [Achromobacter]|uniref:Tripartite tricarboxylate transporter substrate binding protein n=1 Tax=Achromobacter spanius TaxID=217203 RepID=A0ABY8GXN2_9BURK|nr:MULTISPECIES: tripartite tricarboxylate transporter substrate binding protein [Achromobacter]WAI81507.1 tripartite tricarboxylate transporter substrate binding protein [Achromobacter spanius]WEX97024.1 tripartite tricarboxylate transporter substrate binding protein [Achromobacter sp. SS2-2022]WFP09259.1 tripartite tricarboxylate transporter substrate binding protein [Achromobacter spanius]
MKIERQILRTRLTRRSLMSAAGAMALAIVAPSWANTGPTYPGGPIRLVVPFPPGGSVDTVARTLAPQLEKQFGQPVVIENRPGASSVIGAQHVKQSKPDGYTLLLNASLQMANPSLLTTATYDALNDFMPITEIGALPQLLVVRADSPYRTVADLISDARKRPREVQWAIAAFGAAGHLACELVNVEAKVDMPIIPYKGGGPALVDLMGGHVSAMIEPMASAYPHVQSGRLRALAVTSERRLASLPDLPTMAESGFPGFDMPSWYGLWAPAGTPQSVVNRVQKEVRLALRDPIVAEKLASISFQSVGSSPDEFGQYASREFNKYKTLISAARIKAD